MVVATHPDFFVFALWIISIKPGLCGCPVYLHLILNEDFIRFRDKTGGY